MGPGSEKGALAPTDSEGEKAGKEVMLGPALKCTEAAAERRKASSTQWLL